ncbi:MAG: KpsF/GutQ family sugar-phosphate isomerase [Paraprevotella sp.]|nr:KpsF/GutQ family sugar-phosphate isomerase [Paraprevotella sp.]
MTAVRDTAVKCFKDEAQAILDLIPLLDDNFDNTVELIHHCKGKVIITGVGKSGHIGAKMAATLSSTGTPAFFINPLDVFHGDLGVITPDDVVVAISNSGQTDELLRFVPYLLEHNIPLVGISGHPDSLLGKYATYHLNTRVSHEACPLNLAPTSSTTATLAMGDALACALMEVRNFRAKDFAQFHPGGSLGKRLLTTARDVMRSNDLPVISPDMRLGEAIIHVSKGKLGLCVAVEDGKIAGLITDGDVRRAMESLQDKFFNVPVRQVMTRTPKCVSPATKIDQIQGIMHRNKIHTVLVADEGGQLLGVVDHFSCML